VRIWTWVALGLLTRRFAPSDSLIPFFERERGPLLEVSPIQVET